MKKNDVQNIDAEQLANALASSPVAFPYRGGLDVEQLAVWLMAIKVVSGVRRWSL